MSQNMTNTSNVNASNSMFCFQCEQTAGCTVDEMMEFTDDE